MPAVRRRTAGARWRAVRVSSTTPQTDSSQPEFTLLSQCCCYQPIQPLDLPGCFALWFDLLDGLAGFARPILAEKVRYYEDRRLTKLLLDPPAVPPLPAAGRSESEAERLSLEDVAGQPEEIGGLLAPHHDIDPAQDKADQAGERQPA